MNMLMLVAKQVTNAASHENNVAAKHGPPAANLVGEIGGREEGDNLTDGVHALDTVNMIGGAFTDSCIEDTEATHEDDARARCLALEVEILLILRHGID